MIGGYDDFCRALLDAGFSFAGGADGGVFSVIPFDWTQEPPADSVIRWHTGDPDKDPWQWRVRVLNERDDVAYAKLFVGKSGYITREWYPYFLAVRRSGQGIEADYQDGLVSRSAMRIYGEIERCGELAVHDIKARAGFGRDEASAFTSALLFLQMRMYITVCAEQPRLAADGMPHGWPSMVYCTTDNFFEGAFEASRRMDRNAAFEAIERRALELNPNADRRKLRKFIQG